VWPAAPAFAHGTSVMAGSNYRTTITAVSPAVPGLTLRSIEAGGRLELANRTGRTIEVVGYDGAGLLRVRPGATARWHDHRVHWMADNPPPEVAADPTRTHRIRDWVVPLRTGSSTVEARGTLDWLPPPEPGTWWAVCLLAAAAVATLGARAPAAGRIVLAVAALAGGVAGIGYAVGRELDAGTSGVGGMLGGMLAGQPWLLLTSLAAVAAAPYALRRRASADFALALAGACLLISAGLSNATVFSRAVPPVPWDGAWARVAVAAVIAAGAGLTAAGVLRMRATTRAVGFGNDRSPSEAGAGGHGAGLQPADR
jgi:hypothetical protein